MKSISSRYFLNINISSEIFVSVLLCPCYRFVWGKYKDLQRRGKIHPVLCLGGIVPVKLCESGNPLKISHVTDIPTFNEDDE